MTLAPAATPRLLSRRALAWIWYDIGTTAFNTVVVTFVFSVYLTSEAFGTKDANSEALGKGMVIAAVVVALLAPVLGRRSDRTGHPVRGLFANSCVVLTLIILLFFIRPDPAYLWPGIIALAVATIFAEFAGVNYNSLLKTVSTPDTVGKVSAIGWGSGYIGSIALLLILLFAFIQPDVGLFGVTSEDGMHVRASMLLTAFWYAVGMFPAIYVLRGRGRRRKITRQPIAPDAPPVEPTRRETFFGSYVALARVLRSLAVHSPNTLYFLIASAIFRDGLVGVFAFGGVIAAGTFGFSPSDVIQFAVAANLIAGLATVSLGMLDDRIGPKRLIIGSLVCMICAGIGIFAFHDGGPIVFWVLGLTLCIFVGPAQSASRTLLTRLIPHGREGEIFGLYSTTGRALSFMAPAAFTGAIKLGQAVTGGAQSQHWGILGIIGVLFIGLLVLIPVHSHAADSIDDQWMQSKDSPALQN